MAGNLLDGKVTMVTGAASDIGLGRAMAFALIRAGARVALIDFDPASLDKTLAEAVREGGSSCAAAVVTDVRRPEDAVRAVDETVRAFGAVHMLVNNAGIGPRDRGGSRFWERPVESWSRTIETNVNGPYFMARAIAPRLIEQRWGRIVGVTTSFDTMLRQTPYGPSKAAHEALVAAMARELDGTGVTANVLVPGRAVLTNMTAVDGVREGLLSPEVMQAPIVWLASSGSNGFNGRRIIGEQWDESLPAEQRLAQCSRAVAWPELGRAAAGAR